MCPKFDKFFGDVGALATVAVEIFFGGMTHRVRISKYTLPRYGIAYPTQVWYLSPWGTMGKYGEPWGSMGKYGALAVALWLLERLPSRISSVYKNSPKSHTCARKCAETLQH